MAPELDGIPVWAAGYVGMPFVQLGRAADGVDCWGLFRLILAERADIEVAMFDTEYAGTSDGPGIAGIVDGERREEREWREIAPGGERLFDLVLMSMFYKINGGYARADMHVGTVLAPGVMIHIEEGVDAALAFYRRDPHIRRRVVGFYRHRCL